MYRNIINDLAVWQQEQLNKVLLLKGARGVGKTWTVSDFASAFFDSMLLIDLSKEKELHAFLQGKVDYCVIDSILDENTDGKLDNTLIVFDEAQVLDEGIGGILSYAVNRPELRICIIASYMGKLFGEDHYEENIYNLYMYPMTFEEFMTANKAQSLCKCIEEQKVKALDDIVKSRVHDFLNVFYVTGGMPAVVLDYMKHKNLEQVDSKLTSILDEYEEYIKEEAPKSISMKALKVWHSLVAQLSKDNRKFMYGTVDEKARAREYEGAVNWLVDSGLVRRINKVNKGISPLADYVDYKSFELYHLDHGLLRQMAGIPATALYKSEDKFDELNGGLTEQFVLQELTLNKTVGQLYFWISGATARVDFLFEDDGEVIPVDVQSTIRSKAQSLKVFRQRYNNRMSIRISLSELTFSKGILNIPMYGLWNF